MRVLDIIWWVNAAFFEDDERIDKKEFFNDAINNNSDLAPFIIDWAKRNASASKKNIEALPSEQFNMCDYAWILDLKHRVSMLKIYN